MLPYLMLEAGDCGLWVAEEYMFDFLLRRVFNGGLVRRHGGPFRIRPWHYDRCLLSRVVCRSTASYLLILPLYWCISFAS